MKKFQWTKKKILQAAYWSLYALMFLVALVVFQQDGIYLKDFDSQFYKLETETEQQRIFHSKNVQLTQTGFFPQSETVVIEVSEDGSENLLWTLTRQGEDKINISNGDMTYSGTYVIGDFSCDFYFDDWGKYMDQFEISFADGAVSLSERFLSQESIGGMIRIAYGQKDNFGRYSMELFIEWIILVVMAYFIGFHADVLFEWRKAWSFDFRNADQLEPSEWYFASSYLGAAALWVAGLVLYLHMIGLIG